MNRLLLFLALLIGPHFLFAQNISFSFEGNGTPTNNSIWKDTTVRIKVVVYAPAQAGVVNASVAGKQMTLAPGATSTFTGTLSLADVAGDTLTLTVTATDAQNNTGDTTITFIYRPLNDPGVSLTVNQQADSTVARPFFPLQARSPGNRIDAYISSSNYDVPLYNAQDSIPLLDLSPYNGRKVLLKIVATDGQGRTARRELDVFVESSPYLTEYLTVQGRALDFRYNKALVEARGSGYPVLVDASSGQQSAPLVNERWLGDENEKGFVTSDGAVFKAGLPPFQHVYHWRNGQVVAKVDSLSFHLDVAGNYAGWAVHTDFPESRQMKYMDLSTGLIDTINLQGLYSTRVDIAPNGLMVFGEDGIYSYQNHQLTKIIPDPPGGYVGAPATDGYNVIYNILNGRELYFYNTQNQSIALLGDVGISTMYILPQVHYQLNNKYAAFIRGGQIHLRDTLGNQRQINTFGSSANSSTLRLDLLNGKGEITVSRSDSGRIFVPSSGLSRRITATPVQTADDEILSRSFYDEGSWYVLIGRTIFKVNPNLLPDNSVHNFEKIVKPDSVLGFDRQDFSSHFSGPGELVYLTIVALPKHGVLKMRNSPLQPGGGNRYTGNQLVNMTYEPASGFTGTDTIRWTAGNGLVNAIDTAFVIINVTNNGPVVPQPIVAGLSSTYCNASSNQLVKIANLPAPGSGIQASVLLDSATMLPIAADSTFNIDPAALSIGAHSIIVTFSYDTIQKQLPLSFNITSSVTPSLDVSVNVNPITTDSIPVIITATNISGEGKHPLYTFAWDRDFTNQLQLESTSPSITMAVTQFKLGENKVYARVRTSEQCYTSQTGIDSIVINRSNITSIVDVDNPDNPVLIYPNPFRDQISVNGLLQTKAYIISLYDLQGKLLLHKRVVNQTKAEINPPAANGAIYILRVYDEKAKKLLGAQKLVGY
jgi:hypothetical protein